MSRRTVSRNRFCFAICLILWLTGCAGTPRPAPGGHCLPILTLSHGELVAHLRHEAASVAALKGKLEIGMAAKPGDSYKHCRAVLAARSPWSDAAEPGLFLQGYRQLLPTLFTLVSDGREFWLHVPHDNVVYTGPIDGPHPVRKGREIHLDVADLFRALFVQPLDADSIEIAAADSEYTVSLRKNGRLERRLWIERRRLSVCREVYFAAGSRPRLEIDRDVPSAFEGVAFPARVVLRDAASGSSLLLEFGSVSVNPPTLGGNIFRPKIPAGATIDRTAAHGGRT